MPPCRATGSTGALRRSRRTEQHRVCVLGKLPSTQSGPLSLASQPPTDTLTIRVSDIYARKAWMLGQLPPRRKSPNTLAELSGAGWVITEVLKLRDIQEQINVPAAGGHVVRRTLTSPRLGPGRVHPLVRGGIASTRPHPLAAQMHLLDRGGLHLRSAPAIVSPGRRHRSSGPLIPPLPLLSPLHPPTPKISCPFVHPSILLFPSIHPSGFVFPSSSLLLRCRLYLFWFLTSHNRCWGCEVRGQNSPQGQ